MLSRRCVSASSLPRPANRQRCFEMGVTAGSLLFGALRASGGQGRDWLVPGAMGLWARCCCSFSEARGNPVFDSPTLEFALVVRATICNAVTFKQCLHNSHLMSGGRKSEAFP